MTEVAVGEAVTEILRAAGVSRVYSVPGESFLEVLDAVDKHPELQLISTRHESGAAFMAEADAKLTGTPAVAAATRGVGAANLAIGVHTAMQDSTPMVVLVGQVETAHLGKEGFQEVDLEAFFAPITKWAGTAHRSDRVPDLLARAIRLARSGRPGPVMLALPSDVLTAQVEQASVNQAVRTLQATRPPSVPALEGVEALRDLLESARMPVAIVGGGTKSARGELIEFAERFGVGVYASFRRQDMFPNDHPLYLGHLGLGVPDETLEGLRNADLVVVLGCRLSEITTQGYTMPNHASKLAHIDCDPSVAGNAPQTDLALIGDSCETLRLLMDGDGAGYGQFDWNRYREAYVTSTAIHDDLPRSSPVHPLHLMAAMREAIPADAIMTNDAGNFSAFLHRYWNYVSPASQLAPTSGAMGYGLPAAIAASLARPARPVVAVAGDGGFLMTGQELETAVRYELDLTVVVFRNGLYGTIAMHQLKSIGRTSGIHIGPVDLAMFAESLGAKGFRIDDSEEAQEVLACAIKSPGVSVVDVPTMPTVLSPSLEVESI